MPQKIDKEKSARIATAIKRRQHQANHIEVEAEKVKLVIFSLASHCYAFQGSDIKEILPFQTIHFVPGCPDFILGIINVRGDIESVLNLHKILGFAATEPNHRSRIIIGAKNGIRSGILVDAVDHVIDVPVNRIHPPIATLDKAIRAFVSGETTYDNENITILDINPIFGKLTN